MLELSSGKNKRGPLKKTEKDLGNRRLQKVLEPQKRLRKGRRSVRCCGERIQHYLLDVDTRKSDLSDVVRAAADRAVSEQVEADRGCQGH